MPVGVQQSGGREIASYRDQTIWRRLEWGREKAGGHTVKGWEKGLCRQGQKTALAGKQGFWRSAGKPQS